MPVYIVPPVDSASIELSTIASRAGIIFVEPLKFFEIYPHVLGGGIVVVAMNVDQLSLLTRNSAELVPEVPSVVTAVPGARYSGEWMMIAGHLPSVDWDELSGKLAKSGFLANTPEQMQDRGRQTGRSNTMLDSANVQRTAADDAADVDTADV